MQQHNGRMTQKEKAAFSFASAAVDFLTKTYPGYAWTAAADFDNEVLYIIEPTFMDQTVKYVIRLCEVIHSEKLLRKRLLDAGGEILERYCLPREALTKFQASQKIRLMPRDFKGITPFDAQGVPNWLGNKK